MTTKCHHCNGSGEIAVSIYYPGSYRGPGPVPEYAQSVRGIRCGECDGSGDEYDPDAENREAEQEAQDEAATEDAAKEAAQ